MRDLVVKIQVAEHFFIGVKQHCGESPLEEVVDVGNVVYILERSRDLAIK